MAAMALQLTNSSIFSRYRNSNSRNRRFDLVSVQAVSLETGDRRLTTSADKKSSSESLGFEGTKERIAKLICEAEISVSPYDTAWVAMVPSFHSMEEPYFPDCVHWLLENQCEDGSWARPHHHRLLQRDVLSCTLACVLALKKWGVGQEQIDKGVHFIESNFASSVDDCQISPMGFEIIFPGMLEYARDSHLNLRLDRRILNDLSRSRDFELQRYNQRPTLPESLAYVAEGISKSRNWESILRYQRNNGSLFNSPSTTAAAFIHLKDKKCLDYLNSALKKFGNAVPAIHPLDIYCRLLTIDNLERLGISSYFTNEIRSTLDEIYRSWLRGEEEIFMDASTCAIAFRVLRVNGYDVTPEFLQQDERPKDIQTTLELYKASEVLLPGESHMQQQNSRLKKLLEEESSKGSVFSCQLGRKIDREVNHVLDRPFYAILERVANRRNIESYQLDSTRILKTSYSSPNLGNKDFLFMSAADFNRCQKTHRGELKQLERWVVENKLDELKFARSKAAYCYFSSATTIFSPEQVDARISWAKNGVLTTVVDDFFDVGGSVDELKELIRLIEAWDVDVSKESSSSSKSVQIIFSALRQTICEIGDKARLRQGRDVTSHVIQIWLELLKSMMKEREWGQEKYLPSMNEYMRNAYVSFALGPIVLPALYLVGPKISEEMVRHHEYRNLFKLMSTCGRLLNDMRTYEREAEDGKLNAVPLYMMNNGGRPTVEEAMEEIKASIEGHRRELLRLVLDKKDGVLPRPCKDLFWHMSTVVHFFYSKDDGFTSKEMVGVVNEMIHEPIIAVDGII